MSRPLLLTLCLTHDCTLRCRYCYAGRKYARAMTRETAERGIELGLEEAARTSGRLDIAFFGGRKSKVYLVHGEKECSAAMKEALEADHDGEIHVARLNSVITC